MQIKWLEYSSGLSQQGVDRLLSMKKMQIQQQKESYSIFPSSLPEMHADIQSLSTVARPNI